MSGDEDDRTVFGKSFSTRAAPAAPRPSTSATVTGVNDNADEVTLLTRRRDFSGLSPDARVSLDEAVAKAVPMQGKATNPLLSCATDILGVLGMLRAGRMDMQSAPLHAHLKQALLAFREQARAFRVPQDDIMDAGYALAATCDDVARNLPGSDAEFWRTNGLTAELFGDPNPGVGFFTRLHRLSADPAKRAATLEVMFACLALGFEGQYRSAPDGPTALISLRADLYQRIRSVVPRPRPTLSRNWLPVIPRGARRHTRMPIWAIGGVAAAMLVALYAVLAWTMTQEAQAAQRAILDLHDPAPEIEIDRAVLPDKPTEDVVTYEAPQTGQVDRLQNRLQREVQAGLTSVTEEGDFIAIRLGQALQFPGGGATLTSESPIIARIARILENEPGAIVVEGHSDNIPLSGTGRFKTNEDLSAARAAAVRDLLARYLSDPSRLSVLGVGSAKPLDRANTPEARSRNRRVDILLRKEERL